MNPAPKPLRVVQVTNPCSMPWSAMNGDDRVRFCEHCQRRVHNLSALTDEEAVDLTCRNAGALCVRFERAADGTVKTLDYEKRLARGVVTRRWLIVGVAASVAAGVVRMLWARRHPPQPEVLGSML
jgi:hypothetical protein